MNEVNAKLRPCRAEARIDMKKAPRRDAGTPSGKQVGAD
jgi:hypothetical protein